MDYCGGGDLGGACRYIGADDSLRLGEDRVMQKIRMAMVVGVLLVARAEAAKPFLISGYDDVMRQTESANEARASGRSTADAEPYAGMPDLYRALADTSAAAPYAVISGTTTTVYESGVKEFLERTGYPLPQLHLRRALRDFSAEKFKYERIKEVMTGQIALQADQKFIFVFDNSNASLDLGEKLLRENAANVTAIYVRESLKGNRLANTIPIITAFEVAAHEFAAGRMTKDEVGQVASAIVREQKSTRIVPDYAYCPFDYDPCGEVRAPLLDICVSVRTKVGGICEARRKR